MKLKVGDRVKVISGHEKGTVSIIKKISKSLDKVIVENVNIHTKHKKPLTREASGTLLKEEQAIHISNVMLCDSDNIASKCNIRKMGKNKERFSKKTGQKIV